MKEIYVPSLLSLFSFRLDGLCYSRCFIYLHFSPFSSHCPTNTVLVVVLQRYWHHSITLSFLYYAFVRLVQRFMQDRPPLELRQPLFYWNLGLGKNNYIYYNFKEIALFEQLCSASWDLSAFRRRVFGIFYIFQLIPFPPAKGLLLQLGHSRGMEQYLLHCTGLLPFT